jgi:hypothetical protein
MRQFLHIMHYAAIHANCAADSVGHIDHLGNPAYNVGILQKRHSPYVKWNG